MSPRGATQSEVWEMNVPKWMKNLVQDGSFEQYYGRVLRKGGTGLPTANEARKDLERARRIIDPRFPY